MSLKRLTSRSPSGLRPEFRTGHEVPRVDIGPLRKFWKKRVQRNDVIKTARGTRKTREDQRGLEF